MGLLRSYAIRFWKFIFNLGSNIALKIRFIPLKKTTVTIFAIAEPFVRNMNGGVMSIDINDLEISVLFQGQ